MPDANPWSADDMPDLSSRTVVITGGNSGIGYEAALVLAARHANVVIACRSLDRARTAASAIANAHPGAGVKVMELDLANLASVRAFADAFHKQHQRLDVLCNNAGVMAIPYCRTADGFEMQFGTNHLGHFALTGLLMDLLISTANSRVITVSSSAHHIGWIRFDDLHGEHRYRKWLAYGQSKLANLLFAFELQRKFDRTGAKHISIGCTPGYAATNLQSVGPRMAGSAALASMWAWSNSLFAVSAAKGRSADSLCCGGAQPARRRVHRSEVGWYRAGAPGRNLVQCAHPRRADRRQTVGGVRAANRGALSDLVQWTY